MAETTLHLFFSFSLLTKELQEEGRKEGTQMFPIQFLLALPAGLAGCAVGERLHGAPLW